MIIEKVPHDDLAVLQEAFQRFSTTGQVLQEKYEQLKEEVSGLRTVLKQKEAEVKRNERLAMLGKTAAAIAHEIRNPLGAIKLFLSMLQEDTSSPESLKIIGHMHESIERLDSTVANILQFARERKLDMAPVNIPSLIREQVEHFRNSEPETLAFDLRLEGSLFIQGNEESLRRVFFNLILNASQAMRHRGTISIWSRDAGCTAEISVRDTGPGIDDGIRDSLFEPFVTTRGGGTGLGLAIVRQIIEQHGGTVAARSAGGAEFLISLPRQAAQC